MKFNEVNLSENMLKSLADMGFEEMMGIQEKTLPLILEGNDVIGQAQTGTGKTAAFGIPLIEGSSKKHSGVEHLIISPTRELATQIKDELELLGKYSNVTVGLIVGGVDYNRDYRLLKSNPNIIVCTPGRILDHLKNNKLDLSYLKTLTLDEADEMLNIGFKDELDAIIDYMPTERQSLLFSATLSKEVKEIANKMLKNPREILISSGLQTANSVEQYAIVVEEKEKFTALSRLIEVTKPESGIIFGRTKRRADELAQALNTCGFSARALHGDLSQRERNSVMDGFRKGQFTFLVATDVAARGINVENVSAVYNFDLPQEIEYYVHRIGRTGRAGNVGKSYSFLRESELEHVLQIEKMTKSHITFMKKPSMNMVKEMKVEYAVKIVSDMVDSTMGSRNLEGAEKLIEIYGAERALAAALDLLVPKVKSNDIVLTSEPPVRVKVPKSHKQYNGGGRKKDSYYGDKKTYGNKPKGDFNSRRKTPSMKGTSFGKKRVAN